MNRSAELRRGMALTRTTQSDLSRLTGVPQSRISRYVHAHLEVGEELFGLMMSAMGLTVVVDVQPIPMERTKRRSWMLHRELARIMPRPVPEAWWVTMAANLERESRIVHGHPHIDNIARWQSIVAGRDARRLRVALTDASEAGIEMREVSPMSGLLPNDLRLKVLAAAS